MATGVNDFEQPATGSRFTLSPDEPALVVRQGEPAHVVVADSADGMIRSADDVPTPERLPGFFSTPQRVNPVGGPIAIDGVSRGDDVAVTIRAVELDPTGFTCRFFIPEVLQTPEWAALGAPATFMIDQDGTTALITGDGASVRLPLDPFIGTLALAPPDGCDPSSGTSKGPWGGNLDVRDFRAGATVHLQASWDGGLLFAGDLHGMQADMEWSGSAGEFAGSVVLSATSRPATGLPLPRVETRDRIVALGIARPLERAADVAVSGLMRWLVAEFGLSAQEAFLHASVNPSLRINVYQSGEYGERAYTVGAELARKTLPPQRHSGEEIESV
jgi:amidase